MNFFFAMWGKHPTLQAYLLFLVTLYLILLDILLCCILIGCLPKVRHPLHSPRMPFIATRKSVTLFTVPCGNLKSVCLLCEVAFPTLTLIHLTLISAEAYNLHRQWLTSTNMQILWLTQTKIQILCLTPKTSNIV